MRSIEALAKSPKWGNPKGYDLIVEKSRTGSLPRDVEYSVIPEPPSKLDEGIAELAREVSVNLEALYEGEDPFAGADRQPAKVGVQLPELEIAPRESSPFAAIAHHHHRLAI